MITATSKAGMDYCIVYVTEPKKKVKAVKIDKEYVGTYKITGLYSSELPIKKEFFEIYEKHGIFAAYLEVKEDGHAKLTFDMGLKQEADYTITKKYFVDDETGREQGYEFKDGGVALFEQNLLDTVNSTFVKMTDSEIAMLKKGYTAEELKKADKEAEEYLNNDKDVQESKYMSAIERSRRANDDLDYSSFVDASQLAVLDKEVSKELQNGHSYSIVITKEGVSVLKDGKKATDNDPFYKCLVQYLSEYSIKNGKVRSSFADKYVIDIASDGTVKRTQAPEKTS